MDDFLRGRTPAATSRSVWGRQGIVLRISSYLDVGMPPADLVTSVRGVVRRTGKVIVLTNRDGSHYLPGGRLEPGESYREALAREVEEECGLIVVRATRIGFTHLQHETARPVDYPYPYPDMFHLVYVVEAEGRIKSGDLDGYEDSAELTSFEDAARLPHTGFALPFLERARRLP